MDKKKGNFAGGAALLAAAGVLVKVIGACYRIPMTNLVGEAGMALYQYAYPVYGLLLALGTAGLPPAVARAVSRRVGQGDEAGARRTFRAALALMAALGLAGTAGLFLAAPFLARAVGDPLACLPLRAIAPALLPAVVLAAYRGYFQGRQQMLPTALSQLTEQVGKLVLGLTLAKRMADRGVEYAVAGALWGMALAEGLSLALVMGMAHGSRGKAAPLGRRAMRKELEALMPMALPLLLTAMLMPLVGMADGLAVNRRLRGLGMAAEAARSHYGLLTGPVQTLLNMPAVVPMALSTAVMPAVARSAERPTGDLQGRVRQALSISFFFSFPAMVGLVMLAEPLMVVLYGGLRETSRLEAVRLLRLMAPGVVLMAFGQTAGSILHGLGRARVPLLAMGLGAVAKILVTEGLTGIPAVNIAGAGWGSVVCYTVIAIVDGVQLRRALGKDAGRWRVALRPALASARMGVVLAAYLRLDGRGILFTGGGLLLGAGAYLALMGFTGGIREAFFPGKRR